MASGVGWSVGDGGGVKSGGKVGEGSEVGKAVGEAVAVAVAVPLTVGVGAGNEGVSDVNAGTGETSSGSKAQADSKAVTANREGKRQDLASLESSTTMVSTLPVVCWPGFVFTGRLFKPFRRPLFPEATS